VSELLRPAEAVLRWVRTARVRSLLIRVGVLLGLPLALMLLGLIAARQSLGLVAAIGLAPLGVVVFLQMAQQLEWGVIAILATAGFVRFTLPTGTESRIVASMAIAGVVVVLWVVRMLVVERQLRLIPSQFNVPILGFMGSAVVSLVWGIAFRDLLVVVWSSFPFVQLASLAVMLLLPAVFLLVANTIRDMKWLKGMVGLMLLVGVLGLAKDFGGLPVPVNFLGLFPMWIVAISSALAAFDRRLPWWQRILLSILTLGWLWYGYGRRVAWLISWAPSFVVLSVLGVMRSRWLVILVVVALVLVGVRYAQTRAQGEFAESGQTRLIAWAQNWRVTAHHWLFGTGPAGYAAYYMSYFPTTAMATHSNYIDLFAQTGIVGLAFYVWFFGVLVWSGYRLCRRLRGQGGFEEALANAAFAGAVGCVAAMALGDWLIPFAYTNTIAGFDYIVYSWLLLGAIPVLNVMTRQGSEEAATTEEDR
jgi:hypothetical protein